MNAQRLYFLTVCIIFPLGSSLHGRDQDSTLFKITKLDEVVIYGIKSQEFIVGSYQVHFDSSINQSPGASVAEILQKHSSVYIREYGNQMLSTISLRGTGSGHTSTLWNGMNINSPTLGQFDFSQAPTFVTDAMVLHFGGSGSLFGNESIGGSVLLQSQSEWNDKNQLRFYQDAGSYGSYNTRLGFRTSGEKWESSSKAYLSSTKNNFSYINITKPDQPKEKQTNAKTQQSGFVQDIYFRPGAGNQISLHGWYHHSDRQIQPSMANSTSEDLQEDENLRLQAEWQSAGHWGNTSIKLGFLHDYTLFNNFIGTASNQYIVQTEGGKDLGTKAAINLGVNANHVRVNTDNYLEDSSENRWDIYSWLKYELLPFWKLTVNIRASGSSDYTGFFSPSLGSDLILKKDEQKDIRWKFLIGRNYKIPTLNDRFWNPGGNPNLKPEKSLTAETTFDYSRIFNKSSYNLALTVYRLWVNEWIIWLPQGSFWSPKNLRDVIGTGIEAHAGGKFNQEWSQLNWNISYSFTQSINQTPLDRFDRSKGKQLPYIPVHNFSVSSLINLKSWSAEMAINYTGKRYTTTDNLDSLDPFWLVDFNLSKSLHFGKSRAILKANIRNLFNTTYYHLPLRAMPGRNYSLSLNFNL